MNFRTYVNDAYDAIDPDRAVTIFDEPFKLHFVPGEKCPYTFDAKTVGDVVDYLSTSRRYGNAPLSWNVKAYNADWNGKGNPDYKRDETLDKAWDNYLSKSKGGEYVHNAVYEAAQEYYREEWSAYPGDDQGDWVFSFQGRQSGHLCLDRWCGNDLRDMCRSEFAEFVASLLDDPVALSKFYVGIVCADQEFTPTKASENVTYHYAAERARWEEERREIVTLVADAMRGAAMRKCDEYGVEYESDLMNRAVAEVVNG